MLRPEIDRQASGGAYMTLRPDGQGISYRGWTVKSNGDRSPTNIVMAKAMIRLFEAEIAETGDVTFAASRALKALGTFLSWLAVVVVIGSIMLMASIAAVSVIFSAGVWAWRVAMVVVDALT